MRRIKDKRREEGLITNIESEDEPQLSLLDNNDDHDRLVIVNVTSQSNKSIFLSMVHSFSAKRNLSKLFDVSSTSENQLLCLNGIRFLSIAWVLLGHTYEFIIPFTS